ncbi:MULTISPECIES: tetratricopeptide repeat protein [unclassified Anabaena]|uniref:tetratricopeptide repeat protein n=1 Tax=unclassified Anabaena TaxID=2619674 RepID=UPI001447FDB9|nr:MULTISPECIES: tetratricopeptide repeat protein [unclassified Anabaena]MTJ08284.1 tetratricopeptide repeat protein [Anabaena sp. UHCC 0204]MTJ51620.1 tetratricopeptide repeat protein [Anabaena sp. UHCC 0253]
MDWITLLRSLQSDFLKRLTSGCLLHCEIEGQHSELTIISGNRLKTLREFCWLMAEKYKRTSPVRDVFINNLKGKLGEEVVKERLADFITEIDYEKRFGGDGKSDFTLTANSVVGVEVKSRHGSIDRVRWSVSAEEVEKNAVIVCILIQEEVNEAQSAYHLFLAGFLPTQMIKLKTGKISFGINQLLYGGGLFSYLEQFQVSSNSHLSQHSLSPNQSIPVDLTNVYLTSGDEYFQKGEYAAAINSYNQALKLNDHDADIYYKLGLVNYQLGDYHTAIANYSQAINININHGKSYHQRGLAYYQIGAYQIAIEDYTQAIRINPHIAINYKNRADVRSHIGDNQGAIEDYNQAININPHYATTQKNKQISRYLLDYQQQLQPVINIDPDDAIGYKNRGNNRAELGDYEGAIADYTQAIQINNHDVDAYYHRGNAYSDLGNYSAAITDYTQAIKINSQYIDAYYNRGNARLEVADKQGAVEDFHKAADLYWQQGKLAEYKDTQARIIELEIEASLDILNF